MPGKKRVVAQFGMLVERQVISKEVQVMREQRGKTTLFHADNLRRFTLPEIAVMHQECIRLPVKRRCNRRLRGGNGGQDAADFRPALHLQAVWRVVAEASALQEFVQMGLELGAGNQVDS